MSKFRFSLNIIIGFLIFLISCDDGESTFASDDVKLILQPKIVYDIPARSTPVVIAGNTFETTNTKTDFYFGIWVSQDQEGKIPYSIGMTNMKSLYQTNLDVDDRWTYTYGGVNHNVLSVKPNSTFFIKACYPYIDELDRTDHIPFKAGIDDVMFMRTKEYSSGDAGSTENISLEFEHLLSCLEFDIRTLYLSSSIRLIRVIISDTFSDKSVLYKYGYYNIINGDIEADETDVENDMVIELTDASILIPSILNEYTQLYIPIIPIPEYENKRFVVTFDFGTSLNDIYKTYRFELPTIGEENVMEFKKGYKYRYDLTFDNEAVFMGGTISSDWDKVTETDFII